MPVFHAVKTPPLYNEETVVTKIYFTWIKRHSDVEGNELADTLAKTSMSDETLHTTFLTLPLSALKRQIKTNLFQDWYSNAGQILVLVNVQIFFCQKWTQNINSQADTYIYS